MTKRGILLRLLMGELGVDPKLETFRDRLILQKSVYLLQGLGLPTKFGYGWYLRGPYSPALTRAVFQEVVEAERHEEASHEDYLLASETREQVSVLKRLRRQALEVGLAEDKWLELLASMHFYKNAMYFPQEVSCKRGDAKWLYGKLPVGKKESFTEEQAMKAKETLSSAGIW